MASANNNRDKNNDPDPRLLQLVEYTAYGFMAGSVYGYSVGLWQSRYAQTNSIERFRSLVSGTVKGGLQFSVLVGGFHGFRLLLEVTRKQDDVLNYVAAGTTTGAALGMRRGPRGVAFGAAVGTFCGLLFGSANSGLTSLLSTMKPSPEQEEQKAPEPAPVDRAAVMNSMIVSMEQQAQAMQQLAVEKEKEKQQQQNKK